MVTILNGGATSDVAKVYGGASTARVQALLDDVSGLSDLTKNILQFKGVFHIGTVEVSPYTILDYRQAHFRLPNNTDASLFTLKGASSVGKIEFIGGTFDGNRENQGADAALFYLDAANADANTEIWIKDMIVEHVRGYCFELHRLGASQFSNLKMIDDTGTAAGNVNREGIKLVNVYDSQFRDIITANVDSSSIVIDGGADGNGSTTDVWSNVYIGGGNVGLELNGAYNQYFSNLVINDCSTHGLLAHGGAGLTTSARRITINGGRISHNGGAVDNTYDNIRLDDWANHITINTTASPSSHVNKPKYDFNEESANCDYNTIIGNQYYGWKTAALRIQGAHTIYQTAALDQYNQLA